MSQPISVSAIGPGSSRSAVEAIRRWRAGRGAHAETQQIAISAFAIRLVSAACLYLSQAVLARWLGSSEFGTYIYAWTWVLLIGDTAHLGLGHVAQRFIPRYREAGTPGYLLGFLRGSQLIVLASATAAALITALIAHFSGRPDSFILQLAAAAIPAFALSVLFDGVARCYNWIGLALLPAYVLRPLLLIGFVAGFHTLGNSNDAFAGMLATLVACWIAALAQMFIMNRRLAREIAPAPRTYEFGAWIGASFPTLLMWGFFILLNTTDILILQHFRSAEEVAYYYAAAKTLAIIAFASFAVSAAAGHRFAQYHAEGDARMLQDLVRQCVRWTFWGSFAATLLILALGWPLLWLFGPGFVSAYPVMFVLAAGLLVRASIGPAERLLSLSGHQNACAVIYATAFGLNVVLCFILAGPFGGVGVAAATSTAILLESVLFYFASKRLMGISPFVFQRVG